MPSTFTTNLGIEKPADGEQDGIWGEIVNENSDILDRAVNGVLSLSLSGTSSTLTTSDGVLSNGQYKLLVLTGTPSGTHTITIAPNDSQKIYYVRNTTAQSVVFTQGSGGNSTMAAGDSGILYANGAGAGAAVVNFSDSLSMSSVNITGGTASVSTLTATGSVDFTGATVSNGGSVTTVDINGGTIDGAVIGGSAAAAATVTNLTSAGTINFTGATVSNGGSVTTVDINGGTIDGASVGASAASTGAFTAGSFSGDLTISDKIVHAGDSDAAIRFPTNDTVTVETSGIERMRIDSLGNVGLATLTNVAGTRGPTFTKGYVENVFSLSGTTPALNPANGSIQTWTLTGNSTPTDSFAAGESMTLMIDDGTAYSVTWPSVVWKSGGGVPPVFNATGFTVIVLWKVGTTLYGARVGDA